MAGAIAAGNTVVMVPSESQALLATDLYQVLDTSDLPGGVVNIVTGDRRALGLELAKHDAVDAIWAFGAAGDGGQPSRRPRPATSSRPGARRWPATGATRRSQAAARCCATRRR